MPTHPIEGSHYSAGSGALSGERIYKDTDPPTDLIAVDMNAVYHGMRTLVREEQISDDLTTDGATDLSEGFIRFSKAVRRAAARPRTGSIVVSGSSMTATLDKDTMVFAITESGGAHANATIALDQANPLYNDRRLVVIYNASTSAKYVGTSTPDVRMVRVMPGQAVLFYGISGTSETDWVCADGDSAGTFPISFRKDATGPVNSGTQIGTGTLRWTISKGFVTLDIDPHTNMAVGTGDVVFISAAAGATLPAFLDGESASAALLLAPCGIANNSVTSIGMIGFVGAAGSRKMVVYKGDGTSSFTTNFAMFGASFRYPLA